MNPLIPTSVAIAAALSVAPAAAVPEPVAALAPSQRLHLILLGVTDVQRSAAFFQALGWQLSPHSHEGFVRIDMGGYFLALLSAEAFSKEVFGSPQQPAGAYSGIALAHLVKRPQDVAAVLAKALEAGATLVKPVTRTPWGINAFFLDPDGHLFEIDYEDTWVFDNNHRLLDKVSRDD